MQLSEKHKSILKKIWKVTWQSFVVGFITLLIFETIYRFYWIDFYRSELEALNPSEDLNLSKEQTILIFGDSFSADPNGWVNVIRDSLSTYNIINCALPGTTVFHQKLFFKDRIQEFKPDHIIFQLFVGNDLIDYNRPQNFKALSWTRNLYWWFSDQFISLQFLNNRLGRFKSSTNNIVDAKASIDFDPTNYNHRVKNYILADSEIFEESINPTQEFKDEFEQMKNDLNEMLLLAPENVKIQVLVVPAAFQTSQNQLSNYRELGASISDKTLEEFSFFNQLELLELEYPELNVWTPLSDFRIDSGELYYLNDPHLNELGQKVLGEEVLKRLQL